MIPGHSAYATPSAWMHGAHLASVVDVVDPLALGRVKVAMYATDPDGEGALWARVAVSFAGDNCGAYFIPNVGDEVLVVFVAGAASAPVVIGSLWNAATEVPEAVNGGAIDRWTITGRAGTRIAIVEQSPSQEKVEIETPAGVKAVLTDAGGGSITLEIGASQIKMNNDGVTITTGQKVTVKAADMEITSGKIRVNAAHTQFNGIIQANVVVTDSVISKSYTPGAGNVW